MGNKLGWQVWEAWTRIVSYYPQNFTEVLSQRIWYNQYIRRTNKVGTPKKDQDVNSLTIRHIYNIPEGSFMDYDQSYP